MCDYITSQERTCGRDGSSDGKNVSLVWLSTLIVDGISNAPLVTGDGEAIWSRSFLNCDMHRGSTFGF